MTELPDDELDKLFRKSMKELNPNFEQEAWNALSKRLDDANRKANLGRIFRWRLLRILTVLIIMGSLYFLYSDEKRKHKASGIASTGISMSPLGQQFKAGAKKPNNTIKNLVKSPKKDSKVISETLAKSDIFSTDRLNEEPRNISPETGNGNLAKTDFLVTGKSKTSPLQSRKSIKLADNYQKSSKRIDVDRQKISVHNKSNKTNLIFEENKVIDSKPVAHQEVEVVSSTSLQVLHEAGQPEANVNASNFSSNLQKDGQQEEGNMVKPVHILEHHPFDYPVSFVFPSIEYTKSMEIGQATEPTATGRLSPRLAFYFGYSPDLSTVNIKNFSKPGYALFMMAEYSISNRMYLQLGLAKSKKKYSALSGEYTWPSNWKQKILPTSVDGTCKMLEIPFNLRYDITQKSQSRWFATAGVSSYYMANEKYVYNYPPYSTNIKWYDYQVKTGWYLLSHVNVSVGFQYQLAKKLSLIAEPYARIPVKKVGYGKINLTTTGVWVSLRYIPVFN